MSELNIRAATIADAQQIMQFIIELAEYEKARDEVKASVKDIEQSLFSGSATAKALICEKDGQAIGFAVYFYNYSTWLGCNGIYLEDLYITPSSRGSGAGKALLKYLAKKAVDENCGRFEWSVLDWNTPAIEFYESFGAKALNEWVGYRLTGKALKAFAES
ncbi:GNAT family N-acetyltransferase [Oceanospirillum beijerinckii]|uniref:GNAT family N-acetyltransferase n=1 Tax=Oceanospirillum beijerinckii TaxID=64976 RepID=UPI0003FF4541|nr:GNAT family N-acetyltransferase [Oceanospirillum beijerinckii]